MRDCVKRRYIISDSEVSEPESIQSVSSVGFSIIEIKLRGRGRPPHNEVANELRKQKLVEKNLLKELQKEKRIIAKIQEKREAINSVVPDLCPSDPETLAAVKHQPSVALAAEISRHLEVLTMVAQKSKNLKGTFRGYINSAINNIRLAASEITLRVDGKRDACPASLYEEMESLKRELREVREERGALREEDEGLKSALSLHGPPLPPRGEAALRGDTCSGMDPEGGCISATFPAGGA